MREKVHERGFLCVGLWVCNEESRLKFFSKMALFFIAKVLARYYIYIHIHDHTRKFHFAKNIG